MHAECCACAAACASASASAIAKGGDETGSGEAARDEARDEMREVSKAASSARILATPRRSDEPGLGSSFRIVNANELAKIQMKELTDAGTPSSSSPGTSG